MTRSIEEIESEILDLPIEARAHIAARVLLNLSDSIVTDSEFDEAWAAEAERRDQEVETGNATCIPGEDVFTRKPVARK